MMVMVMSRVEKETFRVLKLACSWRFGPTNLVSSNTVTSLLSLAIFKKAKIVGIRTGVDTHIIIIVDLR